MAGAPTALGFVAFAGVKFAGYTCAAWALNRFFQSKENSIWKVGTARTALGLAAGACYGGLFILLTNAVDPTGNHSDRAAVVYFIGLVPVRLAEWSLIIWLFYLRNKENRARLLGGAAAGTVWSFALDAIGVGAALVAPGGVWVC